MLKKMNCEQKDESGGSETRWGRSMLRLPLLAELIETCYCGLVDGVRLFCAAAYTHHAKFAILSQTAQQVKYLFVV